ncbi:MAG: DUF1844 domain-containing protein [Deltaproteobacteria bacterium]|jgi:hypothetical protein|nr:DUF1844 domain-containing protein [Deltaproteobacteria bacterium]
MMMHSPVQHEAPDDAKAMPQVTFSTFILSLASTALVQLGEVPNPESGQLEQNLALGKHTIDVLDMLRAKTRASLDGEEERLLDGILYELRMKYVLKSPAATGDRHA